MLQTVEPFAVKNGESAGFKHIDGFIGFIKTENDHGIAAEALDKGIHIFHVDLSVIQGLQESRQPAGTVRDLNRHHLGLADGESLFLQHRLGCFHIVDDQAQDAEIRGISQGECPDVYAGVTKDAGNLGQAAGLVFDEDGYLFDFQKDLPL